MQEIVKGCKVLTYAGFEYTVLEIVSSIELLVERNGSKKRIYKDAVFEVF